MISCVIHPKVYKTRQGAQISGKAEASGGKKSSEKRKLKQNHDESEDIGIDGGGDCCG